MDNSINFNIRDMVGIMKTIINRVVWTCMASVIFTCCDKADGAQGETRPEKGYVTGKVVDGKGEPIAGVNILVDNMAYHDSQTKGVTDEKGMYKIKIFQGAWKVYANFKTTYNGKNYSIQAYPDESSVVGEEWVVRNFTWKLEGVDPDNDSYRYGGRITVHSADDFYESEGDIELIFTPVGPLIDGSAGKIPKITGGDHYWSEYGYISHIPVGRYNVTASLKKVGGNVPLKIQDWYTKGAFVSTLKLDFQPDISDFRPTINASIAIGY